MAIRYLQDITVNNEITVGPTATSNQRVSLLSTSLTYHSGGTTKGNVFLSSNTLMLNSGASSGGTIQFGAPTSYVQSVYIQGGTLDVDSFINVGGGILKMEEIGTSLSTTILSFDNVDGGSAVLLGDVDDGDAVERIDLKVMGASNIKLIDDEINLNSASVIFGGSLPTGTATKFIGLNNSNEVTRRTASQFRSDLGVGTGTGTVTSVAVSAGTGISISGSPITTSGTITVTNSAPDQTVALSAGTGISISGTYPNFTITNSSPSSGGTVTSVSATAPITSTGGTTPTIAADTAAVSLASSKLATGVQIQTAINSAVSGLGSGTVTSVGLTGAAGLDVTGSPITSSGSFALALDLSEFTDMTGAMIGTDEFIVLDGGNERRKAANEIGLSIFDNDSGFTTNTGTVTSVAASAGTGISISGSPITSSGTLTITNSSPDTGLPAILNTLGVPSLTSGITAAEIRSLIGAGTGGGSVTSVAVTVGTGLDVSGSPITSSGTIDIDLDLSEFTDMTAAMTGTDEFIVLDSGAERRKAANEIGLSIFDNDAGFTTNSGTVTSVGITAGTGISVSGSPVTGSGSITVTNSSPDTGLPAILNSAGSASLTIGITAAEIRTLIGAGTGSGSVTSVGITAGTGISVSGSPVTGSGSITVTNSAPDQTVALSAGTGISISGTYPNFTITNSSPSSGGTMSTWKLTADSGGTATIDDAETVDIAGGTNITTVRSGNTVTINTSATTNTGTVTSVGITAGTGISVAGSPVTSSGSITVTNSSPDTGVPAILSNGSTPSLNTGITGAEVRSLIGAGTGSGTFTGLGTADTIAKFSGNTSLTNSEITDTGSVIKMGTQADPTLYLDTVNKKVGFRTTNPGAAFDVNGTIKVANDLNVSTQGFYVNGSSDFIKAANYGQGNYFGITSSENQPKYYGAFGNAGKFVEAKRIETIKITSTALNSAESADGKIIIPAPGANSVLWPQSIFIYRGVGNAGSGWSTGTNAGANFFFCDGSSCGTANRKVIAIIAGGVCGSSGEWFWGRPVPLPTINENPNVRWNGLKNKPLRFRTSTDISSATMDWYVRIEYLKINVTAGFTSNVDSSIT